MSTSKSTSTGSIKGFLDVKIPARKRKSISLFRVQVWKRKCWVVIRGDRSPAEVNTTSGSRSDLVSLSIEIYAQHEGANYPTEGTILHLDLVHKIRRAKSKSHPYAFEICGRRGETLLYFSGGSETESQKWMSAIRSILWPPAHLESIQKTYLRCWDVSSICVGEVGSEWASLGGLYGKLVVSDSNIIIKDVHNGTTKVDWPLTSIQRIFVATGGEPEDEGKVFIVQTRPIHPCGETFLYFFSLELSELLEGLHEAVSNLITRNDDETSVLSDLSELSGALNSVVTLPQRISEQGSLSNLRKSTSALNVTLVDDFDGNATLTKLSASQLLLRNVAGVNSEGDESTLKKGFMTHYRRLSMSEANLTKICLDETDEELEHKEEYFLEDNDLQHMDVPKDRTSSSGSYNSYRSNDSGVKLSASPSTYADGSRAMAEHMARKAVAKSDSVDSGVRTYYKDDTKEPVSESIGSKQSQLEEAKLNFKSYECEHDRCCTAESWCLQSAQARKSLLMKNFNTYAHMEMLMKGRSLTRTMSESHKDASCNSDREFKKGMENPVMSRNITVYEEIVDVLRPLSGKTLEKEHEYEDLEKIRREVKRSHSFQDNNQPPPLPPRRPQSFSPDPWISGSSNKINSLRKFFGISNQTKSHSTDSMIKVDNADLEGRLIPTNLGSADIATVQAFGTLPRIRRKNTELFGHRLFSPSPKMSPKQKSKNSVGISPNKSPRIPRPKHLFIFKNSGTADQISSNNGACTKYSRQKSNIHSSSADSSLQDMNYSEISHHSSLPRTSTKDECKKEAHVTASSPTYAVVKEARNFLKSPKIVSNTFNFLRKFPKEKYSSLETKRKSAVILPQVPMDMSKVPISYSLDNFDTEDPNLANELGLTKGKRERSMSYVNSSQTLSIQRKHCCYSRSTASPAETPTSSCSSFPGQPCTTPTSCVRNECWEGETIIPPPPCEPHYANLGPDPDYISAEELKSAFKNDQNDGGYLSMGDLRIMSMKNPSVSSSKECSMDHPYASIEEVRGTTNKTRYLGKDEKVLQTENMHQYACPHRTNEQSHSNPQAIHTDSSLKNVQSSRKPSCCEASDYLTPKEVGRLLRRELISARVRELPTYYNSHRSHYHH